jgi:hypothetical protein
MIEALEQRMLLSSAVGMSAVITSPQTLQSNSSIAPQVAPADAGQLVFTSASKATFAAGTAASFTIATSFSTGIQLFESDLAGTASGLPTGLTFHDNGDGTGTLSGTPAIGTGGTYTLVFGALYSGSFGVNQGFILTVAGAPAPPSSPAFTSANHAKFTAGSAGSFLVTSLGNPVPQLFESNVAGTASGLPNGLTFHDNGDATATISGAPALGTAGVYTVILGAFNGVDPSVNQTLTIRVSGTPSSQIAPLFTSASQTSFAVGTNGSFTVTASGTPAPQLFESDASGTGSGLPNGLTFHDNGDGTARISGTPAAGTAAGPYHLILGASNGFTSGVNQSFTLNITAVPAKITSVNSTTFAVGQPNSFTVTATGSPGIQLFESEQFNEQISGLPTGVTFHDNGDGTATLAGTPVVGTRGIYALTLGVKNPYTGGNIQNFTMTVASPAAPVFTSANQATFAVNEGDFTVTTAGAPTPHLFVSDVTGATSGLPAGLTFRDNGDGTGQISGAAAPETEGTYHLILGAANGVTSGTVQGFTLTVEQSFGFNNPGQTTFAIGMAKTFTFTTGLDHTPIVLEPATLPSGLTFHGNGDGTATISGVPAAGSAGTYNLRLLSSDNPGFYLDQSFVLTVGVPTSPDITGQTQANFAVGLPGSFTVPQATGAPTPVLSETDVAGDGSGLPAGLSFIANSDGSATIVGTPATGTAGTYHLILHATNGVSPDGTEDFTLTVGQPIAPSFSGHYQTTFTLGTANSFTFSAGGTPTPNLSLVLVNGFPNISIGFRDNGDGTATIFTTPDQGTLGTNYLVLGAGNGVSPGAITSLVLTIV